jgi:imidazolonepropionase-like amidohydrolase
MVGAAALELAEAGTIVLRNVSIFDPETCAMQGSQDILIEGCLISKVGEVGTLGAGALEIDCLGKYAVAGDAGDRARMAFMMKMAQVDTASVSHERLRQLGDEMKARGVYLCPTLQAFTAVEETAIEQVKEQMHMDEVPEEVRTMIRQQIALVETVSRLCVRELAGQGVKLFVGQDGFEPGGTFAEMRCLRDCGVSAAEIIRGATIYPARWLGVDDRLGSIAPGKEASLLVVEENPLEDVARLGSPSVVIKDGSVIKR